jgi:hypothetical protein
MTDSRERKALVEMAVESWRFSRVFGRALARLDAGEKARFESQLRWYMKRLSEMLDEAGLRLVNVENQPFDPGAAVTPLNLADFAADEALVIDQMLEPIIMGEAELVRAGTVLLRKASA